MATYRRLPSGKWQAAVWHPSGKRFYRTDPLKRVVQEWAQELEGQIRRGDFVDPDAGKITLGAWWTQWQETRTVAPATAAKNQSHWRIHVQPAFGSWPLASIQRLDVEKWVARMVKAKTGGEATATALRLLRQVLEAAVTSGRIRSNPAEGVRAPRPPKHVDRILDVDEAERLLASVTVAVRPPEGSDRRARWRREPDRVQRFFVQLMLEAGLRWQEVAGLHHFRVDVRRRRLRVQEVAQRDGSIKAQPKSMAGGRWVPLTDELLAEYVDLFPPAERDGLVFKGESDGQTVDYSNWLRRIWNPAVRLAELEEPLPTPHDCRHSYGSWLAEQGVPPHEIMVLMGHSSLRAVERYLHASEARMERARQALYARTAHGGESQSKKPRSPGRETGA